MKFFTLAALTTIMMTISPYTLYANICGPQSSSEDLISRDDFPWGQSLEEISALSDAIYKSSKRIKDRAYTTNGSIILPVEESKASAWGFDFDELVLDQSFVEKLKTHIEKIKLKNYGQELIYSDVGHVHIFASNNDINYLKSEGLESSQAEFYEKILHSEKTKFLYHTSEQLGAPKTEIEKWRKENRTVIADALGEIKISPFTKTIEDHSQFFSLYFNANKNGCFSLNHTNFDISLSSPK
jgi:hypothetical protein